MTQRLPEVVLLVCGNVDRRDDGAAVWATAPLMPWARGEAPGRVVVRRCPHLDIEDLLAADGSPVVIVDAAAGVPPGSVVTLSFDALVSGEQGPTPRSSHAVPIAQVIGVARILADDPIDGMFVGIGGADFGFGSGLSTAVREALPRLGAAIEAATADLLGQPALAARS